jgi:hypothetical protein
MRNTAVLVYIMVNAAMALMMVALFLGAGVFLAMLALFAPVIFILLLKSGNAIYLVTANGIGRTVRTWLKPGKPVEKKYSWKDVSSFREGEDMNRSLQKYQYLTISFKDGATWKITDQSQKEDFVVLKNAFVSGATEYNRAFPIVPAENEKPAKPIRVKADFYETGKAKALFIGFLICTGLIVASILITGIFKIGYLFRFSLAIIPGLLYIGSRIMKKKKKAGEGELK